MKYYTHFYEIYDGVADVMIKNYGFERVKYEQAIEVYGWCEIVNPDRHSSNNDKILNKVREKYWRLKKDKKNNV